MARSKYPTYHGPYAPEVSDLRLFLNRIMAWVEESPDAASVAAEQMGYLLAAWGYPLPQPIDQSELPILPPGVAFIVDDDGDVLKDDDGSILVEDL